jgi:hypothetical protein
MLPGLRTSLAPVCTSCSPQSKTCSGPPSPTPSTAMSMPRSGLWQTLKRPLRDRLIEAFDLWTGRYIGPMAKEVAILIETNPELLGPIVIDYPKRFLEMVTAAVAADLPSGRVGIAEDMARTLLSTAGGIKHEATTREEFVARMTIGVDLFMSALNCSTRHAPP